MRLLPPAGPGDVSMDMIIAPLPFRRQKGAPIVACRAEACGASSRRDGGPMFSEQASGKWILDGWEDGWMGVRMDGRRTDGRRTDGRRTDERIGERAGGLNEQVS